MKLVLVGPDYESGWGLANGKEAAKLISITVVNL
jgi:hypothetical protein